tara:strand:+ start:101 stop:481 length:381 start_codon:yes stop_codon:yes gene_type:complete
MRQTFHKAERLKSKIVFGELIAEGSSVKKHPFVLVWKKVDVKQEFPIRIAFSVSKKRFPLAVDRNEMKRKICEIYRLKKMSWYNKLSDNFAVLLIYTSKEKMKSVDLENKLILVFERFIADVEKGH